MATKLTKYGRIFYGGACRDDYPNLVSYDQGTKDPVVRLQRPAMRSLRAAERAFQRRTRGRRGRRPIRQTGTHRTCAFQWQQYRAKPGTFAHPDTSGHPRGICIDVRQGYYSKQETEILEQVLRRHGWYQSRPTDEPWHWSFGVSI